VNARVRREVCICTMQLLIRLTPFCLCLASLAYSQDDELRRAARLDREHKCDEAQLLYDQALAKGPSSAPLLNNVGNHYLICGQPAKAQGYFERLLRINPDHANANLQLARIATDQKQGVKALQYLSHVKESGPAIRLMRAEASHYAGHDTAALGIIDALQQESNSDPRVLFAIGLTCARIGQYDRAEAAFQGVLATRPDDYEVLLHLGRAAARAQHYPRAQRALEVAAKLRPGEVDSLLELGLVYASLQDFSRSVYVLAQARLLAPRRPDVLLALARASEDAGYYGDSAMAYDEYLQIRPSDDTARRDRGRVCGYTDTRQKVGVKELEWYVSKHSQDPIGHYYLSQLTWKSKPELALEQLSTALRLDPKFAPAHFARGWLLYRSGRALDALPHLQTAARLELKNVRALDQLGLAYLSLDKQVEAEKIFRRAVSVAPNDPEALMHLGRALIASDRAGEAEPYLEKFRKLRSQKTINPLREPVMIELATMPQAERAQRQIERLQRDADEHPGDPELTLNLAGLLLAEGQIEKATTAYRELLTKNADDGVWYRAGKSLALAGQYELAIDFLKRAVPGVPGAGLDLGIALVFAGRPQQAIDVIQEVPETERGGDYFLTKARILDAVGQDAEAEKELVQGLRLSSSRPDVAQRTATWLVTRHRKREALNVLSQAAERNSDNPDLLLTRAIVLAMMDRTRDAEQVMKQVESRWPEWDRVYLAHGLILEQQKRTAEARQKLQVAMALGSTDPVLSCSVARLSGQTSTNSACACASGLRELLIPSCR
jgi:Flp pilus assembly protein TadD